jgi:hypothetical protein
MRSMRVLMVALLTFTAFGLNACEKEGPAERAGKEVDKAVDGAGDAVKDAGDKVKDAVDDDE